MAADINSITLTGRLSRDPEMKATSGGSSFITKFPLAYTTGRGDNEKSNFIDCVVWGNRGRALADYCEKGQRIAVSGKLIQVSWQHEGKTHRKHELEVTDFHFIDMKGEKSDS